MKPLGRKEDCAWAVLTALGTTLVVKLAECVCTLANGAVESAKKAVEERATADRREKEKKK